MFIRLTGLSDWTRTACLDPLRILEWEENARELRLLIGAFFSEEEIARIPTHMLEHMRHKLADNGFHPHGIVRDKEPPKPTPTERKEEEHRGKTSHLRLGMRVASIDSVIEHIVLKGSRPKNRTRGKLRLTRAQRKRFDLPNPVPAKESGGVIGKPIVNHITGGLNCPDCGYMESLWETPKGFVCLSCGWGRALFGENYGTSTARGGGSMGSSSSGWRHFVKNIGKPVNVGVAPIRQD